MRQAGYAAALAHKWLSVRIFGRSGMPESAKAFSIHGEQVTTAVLTGHMKMRTSSYISTLLATRTVGNLTGFSAIASGLSGLSALRGDDIPH